MLGHASIFSSNILLAISRNYENINWLMSLYSWISRFLNYSSSSLSLSNFTWDLALCFSLIGTREWFIGTPSLIRAILPSNWSVIFSKRLMPLLATCLRAEMGKSNLSDFTKHAPAVINERHAFDWAHFVKRDSLPRIAYIPWSNASISNYLQILSYGICLYTSYTAE